MGGAGVDLIPALTEVTISLLQWGIDRVRLRESVNSREVCHSPIWHSSKSESALERFEPVAVAML